MHHAHLAALAVGQGRQDAWNVLKHEYVGAEARDLAQRVRDLLVPGVVVPPVGVRARKALARGAGDEESDRARLGSVLAPPEPLDLGVVDTQAGEVGAQRVACDGEHLNSMRHLKVLLEAVEKPATTGVEVRRRGAELLKEALVGVLLQTLGARPGYRNASL